MCATNIGNDLGLTDKNGSCSCETHGHAAAPAVVPADATEYFVEGMTCSHCVASVTEELSAIEGVDAVRVDLNVGGSSTVSVVSSIPLDPNAVRAAVEEAGYSLAAGPR